MVAGGGRGEDEGRLWLAADNELGRRGAEVLVWWRVADAEGTKGGCGLQQTKSCHGWHETCFDVFAS